MTNATGYLRASTNAVARALDNVVHVARHAWTSVHAARQAQRERRALAQLDDRMLKDIGLTRSEAYRETKRDIFDLPKPRRSRTFRW